MVRGVPDGANGFGSFCGFGTLIKQKVSSEGMNELGSDAVGHACSLQEIQRFRRYFGKHFKLF